ncbi:MAG: PQQ-dependent sugar dehydrogenase [Phycisphaera sp.]|nr:PQQ-dependent sugar dehydrogenase [Phycisphaera sp.]
MMMRTTASVLAIGLAMASGLATGVASGQVTTELFASGLSRPVYMVSAPGDDDTFYVVEQRGAIRVVQNGTVLATPFLDIDPLVLNGTSGGNEQGMLGLAFSPDYVTSGRFFVYYIGTGPATNVVEYRRSAADPLVADAGTARTIMTISQPFSNHNGGWMDFGPDGYLYIGTGDGGSSNDPGNRASQLTFLLGKLLRIDVSDDQVPYTVPADNPFVGVSSALPEIWAYGLRNPWRTSFDQMTGDLWIADVGQNTREEVNVQRSTSTGGEHYGWRCREGFIENPSFSGCTASLPPGVIDPIHDYTHAGGRCSITGGYVYYGCGVPEFDGKYVFGDYCSGDIWTLDPANGNAVVAVSNQGSGVSAFAQDKQGEIYVMSLFAGTIRKFTSASAVDSDGDTIPDACETVCLPDVNGDGMVTPADFSAWVAAFNAAAPECDQNLDGMCTPADFSAWVANYNAGC